MAYSHIVVDKYICSNYDNDTCKSLSGSDDSDYDYDHDPCRIVGNDHQPQPEPQQEEQGPVGLTLRKTPSAVDRINELLESCLESCEKESCLESCEKSKPKASNINATLLRIGSWQRVATYEGDLVVKFYYSTRKIVWEVLDNGLKSKFEINWGDISAIRAVFHENHPEILELELSMPPKYYTEINPVAGKHTRWRECKDFTGGQATIYKRHYLQFPEGTLKKHYQRVLQYNSRLEKLSQGPFPSSNSDVFMEYSQSTFPDFSGHQSAMSPHPHQLGSQSPNLHPYCQDSSFHSTEAKPPPIPNLHSYRQDNNFHSLAARPPPTPRIQTSLTPQGMGSVQLMDQGTGNLGIQQSTHMASLLGAEGIQVHQHPYFSQMNQPYNLPQHDSSTEISNDAVKSGEFFGIVNHLFDEQTATTVDPSNEHPTLLARIRSMNNCLLQLPAIQNQTHDLEFSYGDIDSLMEPVYTEPPEFMVQLFLPFEPPVEDIQYPTNSEPQMVDIQYPTYVTPKPEFMVQPFLPESFEFPIEEDVQYPTNIPPKPF